jgi:lipopolysaccharide/colanic/teichoic acid biosynthesis glycosyltransferase
MLLAGLLIMLESGRPIFFHQDRLGKGRVPFRLYKFRSMRQDAESAGPQWATKNDDRTTRVGRMIRRTRIDELPQLFCVLTGTMSLIGPRPIREYFADQLAAIDPRYDLRFLERPGLTGWSQIIGPYGVDIEEQLEKLEMDLYFYSQRSIWDNLYVVLRTVKIVLSWAGH